MSWRRFTTLLYGLSANSVYRSVAGNDRPVLTAKDAPAFFAHFPKRGER